MTASYQISLGGLNTHQSTDKHEMYDCIVKPKHNYKQYTIHNKDNYHALVRGNRLSKHLSTPADVIRHNYYFVYFIRQLIAGSTNHNDHKKYESHQTISTH